MGLTRPQFRLRTLMAIVAVVAIAGAASRLRERWLICRAQVAMHGQIEQKLRTGALSFGVGAADDRRQANFHGRVREYYERAAIRPWLSVAYPPPGL